MASQKAISGNTQKNNGSTILQAGTVSSSTINGVTLEENTHANSNNNKPVVSANQGNTKPVSAGPIANMVEGNYLINQVPHKVAQQDSDVLVTMSDHIKVPVHKVETLKTGALTGYAWTKSGVTYTQSAKTLSFGTDNSVASTGDDPGTITFRDGSTLPVNQNYNNQSDW